MKKSAIAFLSLMASFGTLCATEMGTFGPQAETKTITVQEAVRLALSRSPDVLVAEAQAIRARQP